MPLGRKVGLDPSDIVLDGDASPPLPKKGTEPLFSAMSIVAKRLDGCDGGSPRPGDFVLHGDPVPPQKRGRSPQIFCPCPLWPNGWMDQDATW